MPVDARRHAARQAEAKATPATGKARGLRTGLALLLGGLLALGAATAPAKSPQLKFGTIVPKGSLYHQMLAEVGNQWKQEAGKGARFTIYAGGSQGGENAIVRRMRIGQLHGGMLSSVGLDAIDPTVSAMQFLPMAFRSWEEFDYVAARVRPEFERRLAEKGFIVLLWGEAGWANWYTLAPAVRPEDFRSLKLFGWGANAKSAAVYQNLGFTPVTMETADILPGLQTGLLDAVPMPAFYALAGQFDRVAPHMLELNWTPIVGAAVITKRAWNKLDDTGRAALRAGADAAVARLRERRNQMHEQSVAAMQKRGLTVHVPDAAARAEWQTLVQAAWPQLRGSLVPATTFDAIFRHLEAFRGR